MAAQLAAVDAARNGKGLSVVLAVLTLIIGGVLGYFLNSRREHLAWLRSKRLEAISNLIERSYEARRAWDEWSVYEADESQPKLEQRDLDELADNLRRAVTQLQVVSPTWLFKDAGAAGEQGAEMLGFIDYSVTADEVALEDQRKTDDLNRRNELPEGQDGRLDDDEYEAALDSEEFFDGQAGEAFEAYMLDLLDTVTDVYGFNREPIGVRLRRWRRRRKRRIYGSEDYERQYL